MEGEGFLTDASVRHQGTIKIFWFHFVGAVMSSIFYMHSLVCMYVCICDPRDLFCSLTQRNKQTECLHSCTEYIFFLVIFKTYLWTPALSLLIPHPCRRFAVDQWNSLKSMAGCVRITRELAYVYPHACTWYKQNKDPPDKALIHRAPSGQKLNRVPLTPAGSK